MKECMGNDKPSEETLPRYNYVFLFARYDYYTSLFGKNFYRGKNTRVYKLAFSGGKFTQTLFRLHWSYKINRIIPLPFKSLWFKKICRQDFEEDRPLCFVYLGGNSIRFDGGLTKYIRKKYPSARQVILHMDLIAKKCKYDYSLIRNKVDAAISYDHEEAEKYGISWYPLRFYNRTLPLTEPDHFEYDAYFLGNAKDRLPIIMGVYHKLAADNLRCKFLLTGVPAENQIPLEGVSYISGIPYEENLQYVQKSKCILEIGQGGTSASTLRLDEAVTYHRLLLSNCVAAKGSPYYIPETMSFFSEPEDIDLSFIRKSIDYSVFSQYDIDFSMDRFLIFIDRLFEEKEK